MAIATIRSHTSDEAIRAVARRQHRNVTHAQLLRLGLSQEAIRHIRVTTLARALLDSAPNLTRLTRTVNDALRSSYMTRTQLADVVRRCHNHPAAKLLLPFVASPNGPTRSEFEDLFLAFCKHFGLPIPLISAIVCGYEVDALFAAARVIVELDGWDFHKDRAAFERDRSRDANLLAAGFVVVRITWERLTTRAPEEAARLHRILAIQRT